MSCGRGGPAAVPLRWAQPGDEMAVAAVHVRSWQSGYRGLLPSQYLDGLRPQDRAARYSFAGRQPGRPATMLAVDGEQIRGFATTGTARDAGSPGAGEVFALYVDPDEWGRGVGHALMLDAHRRLAEQGFTTVILWVLVGNDRAQRFYRHHGWREDGSRRRVQIHGITIDEVRYRRTLAEASAGSS